MSHFEMTRNGLPGTRRDIETSLFGGGHWAGGNAIAECP